MFNFIGFLFSFLKGIYNTCAIHTQVNRQANVARILFAGFFGIFSSSINIQHIMTHHSQDDNTYEQIIEQPHTTAFQSQNNHFFSPR